MKKGKLIVIEGTDASGKETQSKILEKKLNEIGVKARRMQFPRYDSPTGKIIGGPYLGKDGFTSYFSEGAANVNPYVASLYYTADRLYNIDEINTLLDEGCNVILDRYIESNMAHQGAKIKSKEERRKIYKFFETLEFDMLSLPRPDLVVFLHMKEKLAYKLKMNRKHLDGHEASREHLKHAENVYIELAEIYDFKTVECANGEEIKSIDEISDEVLSIVKGELYG